MRARVLCPSSSQVAWSCVLALAAVGCASDATPEDEPPDATADETTAARVEDDWQLAPVDGGELEYVVQGEGEPVLMIHGSHVADAFLPLVTEPALADYRLIRYHRRGFAGSVDHDGPFSIADQAADALAVLRHLGLERAHIVGHSYGAVTALQLAHDAPDAAHSLSLLEPPLLMAPGAEAQADALAPAVERYQAGDATGAVDAFMAVVVDPEWRVDAERAVPGGVEQAYEDAATFFEVELPALGAWEFDAERAGRITAPVLWVTGSESGPGPEAARRLGLAWFPEATDEMIEGATHMLQVEEPRAVAEAIARFLARHPLP